MSIDYRIIPPLDAAAVLANPDHKPQTGLGSLGDVRQWIAQHVISMTSNGAGTEYHVATGKGGGPVHLWTIEEDHQPRESYVARDDHIVTTITFMMYGAFDFRVIGQCAAHFRGTIFDHQSSEMLAPEEFLRRLER